MQLRSLLLAIRMVHSDSMLLACNSVHLESPSMFRSPCQPDSIPLALDHLHSGTAASVRSSSWLSSTPPVPGVPRLDALAPLPDPLAPGASLPPRGYACPDFVLTALKRVNISAAPSLRGHIRLGAPSVISDSARMSLTLPTLDLMQFGSTALFSGMGQLKLNLFVFDFLRLDLSLISRSYARLELGLLVPNMALLGSSTPSRSPARFSVVMFAAEFVHSKLSTTPRTLS